MSWHSFFAVRYIFYTNAQFCNHNKLLITIHVNAFQGTYCGMGPKSIQNGSDSFSVVYSVSRYRIQNNGNWERGNLWIPTSVCSKQLGTRKKTSSDWEIDLNVIQFRIPTREVGPFLELGLPELKITEVMIWPPSCFQLGKRPLLLKGMFGIWAINLKKCIYFPRVRWTGYNLYVSVFSFK